MLTERGKLRKKSKDIYYERHHIIPKCMGGTNEVQNLTLLTAREHLIAHRLLVKIHPDIVKLAQALFCMVNITKLDGCKSRSFERIRKSLVEVYSGKNNPNYGRPMSEELKLLHSLRMSGKYLGEKSPLYGKPLSLDSKVKMIVSKTGASEEYAYKRIASLSSGRENNPNFVDKLSAEKIKESNRLKKLEHELNGTKPYRKPMSEESRAKMGKWNIGKTRTEEFKNTKRDLMSGSRNPMNNPEYRKKVAESKIGLIASDETKAKISASKKGSRKVEIEPGIYKIIQACNLHLYPGKYKP